MRLNDRALRIVNKRQQTKALQTSNPIDMVGAWIIFCLVHFAHGQALWETVQYYQELIRDGIRTAENSYPPTNAREYYTADGGINGKNQDNYCLRGDTIELFRVSSLRFHSDRSRIFRCCPSNEAL